MLELNKRSLRPRPLHNRGWIWLIPVATIACIVSVFVMSSKPGLALAFAMGGGFVSLALIRYDLAVYVWIATAAMLPIGDVEKFHIPVLGSVGLYPVQILLIVLLCVGAVRYFPLRRNFLSFQLPSVDKPVLLLIAWAFLSLVVNNMRGTLGGILVRQLLAISILLFVYCMYYLVSRFATTNQRAMGIVVSIMIVGIYNFAWHMFAFVSYGGSIGYTSRIVPYMWIGQIGLIYLIYGALSLSMFLFWEKGGWLRLVFLFLFLTSLVGTVVNFSRWYLLCYGIMLATVLLLKARRSPRWLMAIVASFVLGILLLNVTVGLDKVKARAADTLYDTFWELEALKAIEEHPRLLKISNSLDIWSKHPVFGVGPGNYELNDPYGYVKFLEEGTKVRAYGSAHHVFFQVLGELGAVGALLFIWFLFVVGKETWSFMRSAEDDFSRAFGVAAFAAWVGLFLAAGGYFSDSENWAQLQLTALIYSWTLIGVVIGLKQGRKRARIGAAE